MHSLNQMTDVFELQRYVGAVERSARNIMVSIDLSPSIGKGLTLSTHFESSVEPSMTFLLSQFLHESELGRPLIETFEECGLVEHIQRLVIQLWSPRKASLMFGISPCHSPAYSNMFGGNLRSERGEIVISHLLTNLMLSLTFVHPQVFKIGILDRTIEEGGAPSVDVVQDSLNELRILCTSFH